MDSVRRAVDPRSQASLRGIVQTMESQWAAAMEQLVAGEGFSELLAHAAENAVAMWRIGTDAWDVVLRNWRLAGRGDINQLARQLARAEDKLELLLQAVERRESLRELG
jgi:ketosteroid isomerase-like protein